MARQNNTNKHIAFWCSDADRYKNTLLHAQAHININQPPATGQTCQMNKSTATDDVWYYIDREIEIMSVLVWLKIKPFFCCCCCRNANERAATLCERFPSSSVSLCSRFVEAKLWRYRTMSNMSESDRVNRRFCLPFQFIADAKEAERRKRSISF